MTQVKFVLAKESKLSCTSMIILVLSAREISRANRHLVWISTPFSRQFLLKFFYGCLQNSEKEFWILSSEALAQNLINLHLRNQIQTHFPCPVLWRVFYLIDLLFLYSRVITNTYSYNHLEAFYALSLSMKAENRCPEWIHIILVSNVSEWLRNNPEPQTQCGSEENVPAAGLDGDSPAISVSQTSLLPSRFD